MRDMLAARSLEETRTKLNDDHIKADSRHASQLALRHALRAYDAIHLRRTAGTERITAFGPACPYLHQCRHESACRRAR